MGFISYGWMFASSVHVWLKSTFGVVYIFETIKYSQRYKCATFTYIYINIEPNAP